MTVRVKLLEPFNCRPAGGVVDCNVMMAAELIRSGVGVETDEEVTENPGAVVEVVPVMASAQVEEVKRRGRPPQAKDDESDGNT